MKTSELIKRLAEIITTEGDIPVCVLCLEQGYVEIISAFAAVDKMINEEGETKTELFVVVDCV